MSLLLETAIFYALIGGGVAVAVYIRQESRSIAASIVAATSAALFWPIYVPLLLASSQFDDAQNEIAEKHHPPASDAMTAAINQVETELDAALEGLDGWAENVLASEAHRLEELRTAWKTQADRIRDLDHLLARPESQSDSLAAAANGNDRARQSEEVRRQNVRQLQALRQQMHGDLIGTLAWVRELVTMIHLAKYSGAPAARAEELVAQIAAAVEGLSEVSAWREGAGGLQTV
ncbi:MAG: hypothetical protein WD669_04250 [Pirellulales bacterium]